MDMHEAMRYAQFLSRLTRCQLNVLRGIVKGLTPEQVARECCNAGPTISSHLTQIYKVTRDVWKPLPGESRDFYFLYAKFEGLRQNDELWSLLSSVHRKQLLQVLLTVLLRTQHQSETLTDQDKEACAQVIARLTKRQLEVLHAVAEGLTPEQVAQQLGLSPKTVYGNLAAIFMQCDFVWGQTKHSYKHLKRKFALYFRQDGKGNG
jgi:DNA-binding NarL/FixJ family response regulator